MAASKTHSVPALERALSIMEVLSRSKKGRTLSQLTRDLGLPRSSVHCLLLTFERCGYLQREPKTGRYRIALRVCDLAHTALSGITLREEAVPVLRNLMQECGLTVHMGIPEQGQGVLVEKLEPPGQFRIATWVSKRLDLHCTAVGKSLLAHLPAQEVAELIGKRGLLRHNDNTICSARKLKEELDRVRQRGYAVDDEEEEIGIRCVGAPVFNEHGQVVAAVSIVGTTSQIGPENCEMLAGKVMTAAREITDRLRVNQEGAGEGHGSDLLHFEAAGTN